MNDISLYKGFLQDHKQYYDKILEGITWHSELQTDKGDLIKINRKMAYVFEQPIVYKYANLSLQGQIWTNTLLVIREKIEEPAVTFGAKFNSCLLNLYETGKDEIRWHSDKEPQLGENPVIACVNLGHARTFWFLKKSTGEKIPYLVEGGDLLVMGPNCQKNYLHAILKEKETTGPRISLTYRWVNDNQN